MEKNLSTSWDCFKNKIEEDVSKYLQTKDLEITTYSTKIAQMVDQVASIGLFLSHFVGFSTMEYLLPCTKKTQNRTKRVQDYWPGAC